MEKVIDVYLPKILGIAKQLLASQELSFVELCLYFFTQSLFITLFYRFMSLVINIIMVRLCVTPCTD
jgi:hypothetical protein